jgi:large subunit ribosomal protein L22
MATVTTDRPTTRAQVRYLRMSATKLRVVLDLIRGKSVNEALQILAFSERLAARDIAKVLRSAVANAEHNDGQSADELVVAACWADEGPTLKRFRPKARGRAGKINKRTAHITVEVARMSDEQLDALRRKETRTGRPASGDTAAARRRRVARSRGEEQAPADEAPVTEVASDETGTEQVATQVSSTGTEAVADEAPVTEVTTTDTEDEAVGTEPVAGEAVDIDEAAPDATETEIEAADDERKDN